MTGPWMVSFIAVGLLLALEATALAGADRGMRVTHSMLAGSALFAPSWPTRLRPGRRIPDLRLTDARGGERWVHELAGRVSAIVVISPGCVSCRRFIQFLGEADHPLGDDVGDFVIVSIGDLEHTTPLVAGTNVMERSELLFDEDQQVLRQWGINIAPATVVVDDRLRVRHQAFGGREHMEMRVGRI